MSIPTIVEVFDRVCACDEMDKTWKNFQQAVAGATFPNDHETEYVRLTVEEMESEFNFLILWTLFSKFFDDGDLRENCETEVLRSLNTMIQSKRTMLIELICDHRKKQKLSLAEMLEETILIGKNILGWETEN